MSTCTLCDLPTPDPPITAETVEGEFCCRGCLEVASQLDAIDAVDDETISDALASEAAESIPESAQETAFLNVDGMHCATCETFLEARAGKADGIVDAEASYAADLMKVTYDPEQVDRAELSALLSGSGYTARDVEVDRNRGSSPPWRLLVGVFLGMPMMTWYVVFLYPRYFGLISPSTGWAGGMGIASLVNIWVLTTIVLGVTGYPILRGAYVSLRAGRPNMDLLVALAAVNAYVYSTLVMVRGGTEVYFDIAVVIVIVVTLGHHYEDRIKRRASSTIARLTEHGVDEARRRTPDGLDTVRLDDLGPGDEVVVRPGERIPVDGHVTEGEAAVDESLLTGESMPARKAPGDTVIGGSVVTSGSVVLAVPEEPTSTVDRLVTLLWEVQSSRSGVQRFADRLAAVFVPLVVGIALAAGGWQFATGADGTTALLTGLTVLVVSCPCALGLATPLAVAAGIRQGLEAGVVITNPSVFETAAAADTIAFDKTGTLTTGEMRVVEAGDDRALRLATAVEAHSSHPIAEALTSHTTPAEGPVSAVTQHAGRGVSGRVGDRLVVVGHPELFRHRDWTIPDDLVDRAADARHDGNVPVVIGWDGRARSLAVVGDEPRDGWAEVVTALAGDGREIVVITGDSEAAARRFRDHPDIDRVFTNVAPEAKTEIVGRLRSSGTTVMVGDGTNDAPSLAAADLGIALSTGTAIAADAADVVVRSDSLDSVAAVFGVVGGTKRRIRENLGWAFLYNVIAIPVAALGFLNPLVAAVAMASSSLLVVSNSARRLDLDRHSLASRSLQPQPVDRARPEVEVTSP